MPELILRLEQHGQTLGEWTLTEGPLSMSLRNPTTGETVATFRASVPADVHDRTSPLLKPTLNPSSTHESFDAPTEDSRHTRNLDPDAPATLPDAGHYDEIGVVGLSADGEPERIPGDDFTMPNPEPTDPAAAGKRNLSLIGAAYLGEKTATMADVPDSDVYESVARGSMLDETTYIRPDEPADTGRVVKQAPRASARQASPSASEASDSAPADGDGVRSAAAFPPIGSAEPDPLLEVWFYKNNQWVRRGWLSSGQRASLRGGVIRCTRGGALLVSPGTWFTVSAVLPSGKQLQVEPGSKPVRLPSGSAVTLWDGERGLHVRDVETADDDTQGQRMERTTSAYRSGQAAAR